MACVSAVPRERWGHAVRMPAPEDGEVKHCCATECVGWSRPTRSIPEDMLAGEDVQHADAIRTGREATRQHKAHLENQEETSRGDFHEMSCLWQRGTLICGDSFIEKLSWSVGGLLYVTIHFMLNCFKMFNCMYT